MTLRIPTITILALLFFALMLAAAVAQEPLPEPKTAAEAWAQFVPQLIATVLAGVGIFLSFAIRRAVALLPSFIAAWIDTKRQRDLHSAIMTKVAQLIQAGRWPRLEDLQEVGGVLIGDPLIEEIRDYANLSVPQAVQYYGLGKPTVANSDVLRSLAVRYGLQLQGGISPAIAGDDGWRAPTVPTK